MIKSNAENLSLKELPGLKPSILFDVFLQWKGFELF